MWPIPPGPREEGGHGHRLVARGIVAPAASWDGPGTWGALGAGFAVRRAEAAPLATLRLDYAYYNPVALVLKDKGWVEEEFGKTGTKVEWVLSLGSNKALEFLNGSVVDFGSSAGSAALMARANGNPIKAVYIYSRPEWTALVTSKDSPIQQGHRSEGQAGGGHPRHRSAHLPAARARPVRHERRRTSRWSCCSIRTARPRCVRGDVDAWAGLDPYMAQTELEDGSRLFFRDPGLNTYGFLNVREAFAAEHPDEVIAPAARLRARPTMGAGQPGRIEGSPRQGRQADRPGGRQGAGAHRPDATR